jgi:hypothetical protein
VKKQTLIEGSKMLCPFLEDECKESHCELWVPEDHEHASAVSHSSCVFLLAYDALKAISDGIGDLFAWLFADYVLRKNEPGLFLQLLRDIESRR